jgi:hypothetical protein
MDPSRSGQLSLARQSPCLSPYFVGPDSEHDPYELHRKHGGRQPVQSEYGAASAQRKHHQFRKCRCRGEWHADHNSDEYWDGYCAGFRCSNLGQRVLPRWWRDHSVDSGGTERILASSICSKIQYGQHWLDYTRKRCFKGRHQAPWDRHSGDDAAIVHISKLQQHTGRPNEYPECHADEHGEFGSHP